MKLWLSKSGDVPVREQLISQIILGIVSNELKPGERLPSTRELARRLSIHSNTVSAAYRRLENKGWVEFRKGSGIYVRSYEGDAGAQVNGANLDRLVAKFFQEARTHGFTLGDIKTTLDRWLGQAPPDHFLLLEADKDLADILVAEIQEIADCEIGVAPLSGAERNSAASSASIVLSLLSNAEAVRASVSPETSCLFLSTRSIPESLAGQTRPPGDALVTVASGWQGFLQWSRTVLVAAGLDAESLNCVDTSEAGWQRRLAGSAVLVTDARTAKLVPHGYQPRIFRILSDAALSEIRSTATQAGLIGKHLM